MIIHYLGFLMEKIYIIQKLKIEKDNFLDEKHLDWYVLTFIVKLSWISWKWLQQCYDSS